MTTIRKCVLPLALAFTLQYSSAPAQAQTQPMEPTGPYTGTTMAIFPVARNQQGAQVIITRNGMQLPIPGAGVSPQAQQMAVYRDNQGNYWFEDATGRPVKVTMQQISWEINKDYGPQAAAQANAMMQNSMPPAFQGQPPQQMPPQQQASNTAQQPPVQNNYYQEGGSSSGSSGGSGLVTGLAAAGGAFAGSIVGDSIYGNYPPYHGVPYGTPIYHGGNNQYYYVNNGQKAYVNQQNSNNDMFNQFNKQGNSWQDRQQSGQLPTTANQGDGERHGLFGNRKDGDGGRFGGDRNDGGTAMGGDAGRRGGDGGGRFGDGGRRGRDGGGMFAGGRRGGGGRRGR